MGSVLGSTESVKECCYGHTFLYTYFCLCSYSCVLRVVFPSVSPHTVMAQFRCPSVIGPQLHFPSPAPSLPANQLLIRLHLSLSFASGVDSVLCLCYLFFCRLFCLEIFGDCLCSLCHRPVSCFILYWYKALYFSLFFVQSHRGFGIGQLPMGIHPIM